MGAQNPLRTKIDVNQNEFLDKLCYENDNPLLHPLTIEKLSVYVVNEFENPLHAETPFNYGIHRRE